MNRILAVLVMCFFATGAFADALSDLEAAIARDNATIFDLQSKLERPNLPAAERIRDRDNLLRAQKQLRADEASLRAVQAATGGATGGLNAVSSSGGVGFGTGALIIGGSAALVGGLTAAAGGSSSSSTPGVSGTGGTGGTR